jgi:MFS family permease
VDLSKFNWRTVMGIATVSMLLQQAFSYVCQMVMPVLADSLAEQLGISRAWLGFYLFIQNLMAIIAAVGCGGFLLRYGPLRVSQVALVLMATSLMVVSTGWLWLYPIGAILLGASAVSTPASSHILARVCPPHLAPLVFSVKQTGVPVGSLIGGFLIPFLLGFVFYAAAVGTTVRLGPFGAAFGTALLILVVAIALQPLRAYFDRDRQPAIKIAISDLGETMRIVMSNHALRDISFAAFAFGGLQSMFAGFFILMLIDDLGYSATEAGSIFALASVSAIIARILWGWLGTSLVSPRWIFSGIGLLGGGSAIAVAFFDVTWTMGQITLVAVLFNISALSWHGILLSETARLSPPDMVGGITGGVLSCTSVAMMIYPAIYGFILASTGSYGIGFAVGSVPAFIAFFVFLGPPVPGPWLTVVDRAFTSTLRPKSWLTALGVLAAGAGIGTLLSAL